MTKLKNSSFYKTENWKGDKTLKKKLESSNCDKNQKLQLEQNAKKNLIVKNLKNSNLYSSNSDSSDSSSSDRSNSDIF